MRKRITIASIGALVLLAGLLVGVSTAGAVEGVTVRHEWGCDASGKFVTFFVDNESESDFNVQAEVNGVRADVYGIQTGDIGLEVRTPLPPGTVGQVTARLHLNPISDVEAVLDSFQFDASECPDQPGPTTSPEPTASVTPTVMPTTTPPPTPTPTGWVKPAKVKGLVASGIKVGGQWVLRASWHRVPSADRYEYRVGSGRWTLTSRTKVALPVKVAAGVRKVVFSVRAINRAGAGPARTVTLKLKG